MPFPMTITVEQQGANPAYTSWQVLVQWEGPVFVTGQAENEEDIREEKQ